MTLEDYMVSSGYFFLFYGFPLIMLVVVLVVVQTWTLSRRLDKHLFNENYFTPQEMAVFSSFPLSLLKTLGYIRLITFPNSLRKRFGTATARDKISTFAATLSHSTIVLIIVNTLIILNLLMVLTIHFVQFELWKGENW